MKLTVKRITTLLLLLLGAAVAGCNTMEGLGEDIEAAGSSLEESAEENMD